MDNEKVDSIDLGFPIFAVASNPAGYVAVGGGGGSSRTGIKNALVLYHMNAQTDQLEFRCRLDTGDEAVMNVTLHPREPVCVYGTLFKANVVSFKGDTFTPLRIIKTDFVDEAAGGSPKDDTISEQRVVKFSRFGDRMATGGTDGTLRLWRFPTFVRTRSLDVGAEVLDVDMGPRGNWVAVTTNADCSVFSLATGRLRSRFGCVNGTHDKLWRFRGCRFTPDGAHLLTGEMRPASRNHPGGAYVAKWNLEGDGGKLDRVTGRLVHRTQHHTCMAISPNGRLLALATAEGRLLVVRVSSLARVMEVQASDFVITGVVFDRFSRALVSVSANHSVAVHRVLAPPAIDRRLACAFAGLAVAVFLLAIKLVFFL